MADSSMATGGEAPAAGGTARKGRPTMQATHQGKAVTWYIDSKGRSKSKLAAGGVHPATVAPGRDRRALWRKNLQNVRDALMSA